MKKLLFAVAVLAVATTSCKQKSAPVATPVAKTDVSEFFGQWTIDIASVTSLFC